MSDLGKCDFCGDTTAVFVAEDAESGAAICEGCADQAICAFMTDKSNEEEDEGDE